ncbi:23S rRNA (pseudouridine(1915)-N(3))-methyltransferase RlmH [Campylobacter sp. MIT 19-121]|uniref:23S rRNA (pseudouridine(1915)-N(3))-methyltransferase RlmH n=1 Tax=Campylobacter sp. MIT 19-121 TaxID=2703906 RepID=UPI001389D47E|nr:23S rRNA (pseudouridine(1915)-N(3))-methyltransferase RlmH [Campylobacter sp. MIT 19-121]NDJ27323.1 23S rRNA (pseudouridine(1915)-N(3))-methyltransferase RlmH [Campylobacter sp. MIT 19-121]
MQIHIICVQKKQGEFQSLEHKYTKLISHYARLNEYNVFNNKIANAHKLSASEAKKSYEEPLLAHKKGYSIILDERGKSFDSLEFSRLLVDKSELSFFIGGAYGFEKSFLSHFDLSLSLSKLTLAHHLVKIVLLEQIYRAFCLHYQHPYHK